MAFDLEGYNTVPDRIGEFRKKHPEGSFQQVDLQFVDFAGASWVVYTAAAYRTPDDPMPGHGTAWEPVPGKTQFTRDSELQNAETAAWGRAIVAVLAADVKKGVASREEVRNRQPEPAPPAAPVDTVVADEWLEAITAAMSIPQLQAAWDEAGKAGVTRDPRLIKAKDAKKKVLNA